MYDELGVRISKRFLSSTIHLMRVAEEESHSYVEAREVSFLMFERELATSGEYPALNLCMRVKGGRENVLRS